MVRKLLALAVLSASLLHPAIVDAVSPTVEVAFSPNGGAAELVVRTIESAKTSIRVAAYSFTSKPISIALLAAHKRGVDCPDGHRYEQRHGTVHGGDVPG